MFNSDFYKALRPKNKPEPLIVPPEPVDNPWPNRDQQAEVVADSMETTEPEPTPENTESKADRAEIARLKAKNGDL